MLTCIARSKQPGDDSLSQPEDSDSSTGSGSTKQQAIKSLTSQLKDMALKASGAYRHCSPCTAPGAAQSRLKSNSGESDADSDRFRWSYRRTGSSSSTTPRTTWGKEMEARLKGISSSSGEATPIKSVSGRRVDPVVFIEENEPKEWVAQVEPGVLITFVSLPRGGNDLKRIRFSRDMFNKWQAQRWWAENYDRVMELYNVQRFNRQAFPLPTPPRSEDESSKIESVEESPVTPPLTRERLPRNLYRPTGMGMGYSSSDSLDHHPMQARNYYDSGGLTSTPKLSSISGAKTETSSMDASIRSSSSRDADRSGELSISNASDLETEWVEQDEPGVYITIRALPGGKRELRRVRFRMNKKLHELDLDEEILSKIAPLLVESSDSESSMSGDSDPYQVDELFDSDDSVSSSSESESDSYLKKINVLTKDQETFLELDNSDNESNPDDGDDIKVENIESVPNDFLFVLKQITTRKYLIKVTLIFSDDFAMDAIALFDTGADLNCIREDIVPKRFHEKTKERLSAANNSKLNVSSKIMPPKKKDKGKAVLKDSESRATSKEPQATPSKDKLLSSAMPIKSWIEMVEEHGAHYKTTSSDDQVKQWMSSITKSPELMLALQNLSQSQIFSKEEKENPISKEISKPSSQNVIVSGESSSSQIVLSQPSPSKKTSDWLHTQDSQLILQRTFKVKWWSKFDEQSKLTENLVRDWLSAKGLLQPTITHSKAQQTFLTQKSKAQSLLANAKTEEEYFKAMEQLLASRSKSSVADTSDDEDEDEDEEPFIYLGDENEDDCFRIFSPLKHCK
ncbi:protein Brevis radix-like 4 [Citrus sinensis]|uniref:Protein Brevis radix-like 4 n=1 Tax=Citrus sinensis TaxID=2711 RepID=A0ACB8NVR1_CITSI|nr:protein Brevis radix-like 4 [Citrus sinensis]